MTTNKDADSTADLNTYRPAAVKQLDDSTDERVAVVSYRGFEIPVYLDEPGQQFYCIWDGEPLGFGSFNTEYVSDIEYLIDRRLDTIHIFQKPYFGARLEWFDNQGFRDIKLSYRSRLLKIFLMPQQGTLDEQTTRKLIADSLTILYNITQPKTTSEIQEISD